MDEFLLNNMKFLLEETDKLEARIEILEAENKALKQALGITKGKKPKITILEQIFK